MCSLWYVDCHVLCSIHVLFNVCTCLVSQMIASKYLNDEGEMESILNSEWAKIGKPMIIVVRHIAIERVRVLGVIKSSSMFPHCL